MNNYEINSDFQEIKKHGTSSFPFMIYNGKMPDYQSSYPLHWHEEMEIIFVVSGIGAATVNYTSYNLKEGDILLEHQNCFSSQKVFSHAFSSLFNNKHYS
ncbi:MAG: cupin domain-containing protein [Clostridiales bacterium]|nr:cupin domain-containing protein [Clostridiales bacterium]